MSHHPHYRARGHQVVAGDDPHALPPSHPLPPLQSVPYSLPLNSDHSADQTPFAFSLPMAPHGLQPPTDAYTDQLVPGQPYYENLLAEDSSAPPPLPPFQLVPGLYNEPPLGSDHSALFGPPSAQRWLQDTAEPIQVSRPETAVLAYPYRMQPGTCRPSQDQPRKIRDSPYAIPPSRGSTPFSLTVSRTSSLSHPSTLLTSLVQGSDNIRRRAPRGTHKKTVDPTSLRYYSPEIQRVLVYARHALANDMVNKLGWPFGCSARNAYKDAVKEVIEQANNTLHGDLKLDTDIETVIIKEPSYVRSKLVEAAEEYAERCFETHDAALVSDVARYEEWKTSRLVLISDHQQPSFFLHEHDSAGNVCRWFGNSILESLHINFWYTSNASPVKYFVSTYHTTPTRMYALSATALLCASRRVAMGCKHNSGNTIAFTGDNYGPIFDAYHTAILEYANHTDIGTEFNLRMDWLNAEGLKNLNLSKYSSSLPKKISPVYVPLPRQPAASTSTAQTEDYCADYVHPQAEEGPSSTIYSNILYYQF